MRNHPNQDREQEIHSSIARKLLVYVLSIYLVITVITTLFHVASEYQGIKSEIQKVLVASQDTFHDIMENYLWNYDLDQLQVTVDSITKLPQITGIKVIDLDGNTLAKSGEVRVLESENGGELWHTFSLFYHQAERKTELGKVHVYSDPTVILDSLKSSIYLFIVNALLKTLAILLLVSFVFNRLLTKPLWQLAVKANAIDPNNLASQDIAVAKNQYDEIGVVQKALNSLMAKTSEVVGSLDKLNKELEQRVEERTQALKETVSQLDLEQTNLKNEVSVRKQSEAALEKSLDELKLMQSQLIESEKMASLGGLVAGVAHEINTPVGLSLTGITHFEYAVNEINESFKAGELDEQQFERFISESAELAKTIHVSLARAANLVKSFKQVAVDQSIEENREFDLLEYLDETMISLNSKIKQSKVNFQVQCNLEHLLITSLPGAWAQIFTNLIQNTLIHAYEANDEGEVTLLFSIHDKREVIFTFRDDGKGMTPETLSKVFEPFYTTNRSNGGSGLGMNIIYNLVTQKLKGSISVESELGKGTTFTIKTPISIQSGL